MEIFGVFTLDRQGYDRRHGVVDDEWRRFGARWNIWERSHVDPPVLCNTSDTTPIGASPNRDDDGNGTEDECEAVGRGSHCDDVVGECKIPYRDRGVKTIVWHVNQDHPDDLFESSAEALAAWDDAVRVAVVSARVAECRRTGEADCEVNHAWPLPWSDNFVPEVGNANAAQVPTIFALCHNPVDPEQGDDEELCGAAGTSPRLGDLRYNFIAVIDEAQASSPWGIMMDAEDPLTGEKIAGSVNVWAATGDRAAGTLVDLLGLLNGDIDPTTYIKGENISDWVKANQRHASGEQAGGAMSAREVTERMAAYDPQVIAPYLAGITENRHVHPRLRRQKRLQALTDHGRLGPGNAALTERLTRLQGTEIEARMISPDVAQLGGHDPTGPMSADVIKRSSPFGRMNPAVRRANKRAMRLGQVRRHACRYEGPEPDNMIGLAKVARDLFPSPDPNDPAAVFEHRNQVFQWAREGFNRGVMAHEIGHSMGLRHNFGASWDSINYDARYWQLRTNNLAATADCPDGNTDGASCIGPRWRDPITPLEQDWNIGEYATTSVMDYPGDQSQDMILPGKYDKAAMRFIYGNVVDVWEGVSVNDSGSAQQTAYNLTSFALGVGLDGARYHPPTDPFDDYNYIHYSQYQSEFEIISNCQASDEPGAVLGSKCDEHAMDVVDYRDMSDFIEDDTYADFPWAYTPKAVDPRGRVRRGYLFSSDEYADAGNVPSFSSDAGADPYEQVRFLEGMYENRYVLDAFRRERVDFNSEDTVWRMQGRYLDNIQQIAKTFAFAALLEGDPAAPDDYFKQDGLYGPLTLAGTIALDLFARQLTRPEPGYYCTNVDCGAPPLFGVQTPLYQADSAPVPAVFDYPFRVALGDGRYLHNDYDYSEGYWWGDYQLQVGAYYDKIWAVYYLAEAFDYFISSAKEDFTDSRYKNLNFATVFPDQVRRLFNALLTNDYDTFAPWVDPAGSGELATLQYPNWYDPAAPGMRPATAIMTDPNYSWNEQVYAMVWGAMFFPTNWSDEYIHHARIAATPAEQPSWPDADSIKFFNPITGVTYVAHSTGTEVTFGFTREKSAGARMIEWANTLVTHAYIVDRDVNMDPILDVYGSPTLTLDVNLEPQVADAEAVAVLQNYVANIDQMRQVVSMFMQPLDDWGPPQP
jgi:hypothetical protein